MKKNIYRISLLKGCDTLAKEIAVLAAMSNGHEKRYSLPDLKTVADGQRIMYPSLYGDSQCELIGEHILHLDMKVKDAYETVLILEEVEIIDLMQTAPTLSRYDAQTIIQEIEQNNDNQN